MNKTALEEIFEKEKNAFLDEWKDILTLQSISADPSHAGDCIKTAEWLTAHLNVMGFNARMIKTSTNPLVYAERYGKPDSPTLLIYGHYDVQPVNPLKAWDTPPFDPVLRNGRMYARGAQDNKGQLLYTLKAIQTLLLNDCIDASLKIIIDGDEENGSAGMTEVMTANGDMFAADILMVHDTATVLSGAPTIVMGLRGVVHLTATLDGPEHDLHSGIHGGLAPNPAQGMAQMTASLFNNNGGIAIDGYYDSVTDPTKLEKQLAASIPHDEKRYKKTTGVASVGGEKGITPTERTAFRPSIDINGIHSGYGEDGASTIIPSTALAKISARLVPDQDPETCLNAIINHLRLNTPDGLTLTISDAGACGCGFRLDPASDCVHKAESVMEQLDERKTAFLWEGASIPIITALAEVSGASPLLAGFGHEEDRIHAPNESFSIEQFKQGFLYVGLVIQELQKR